MRYIILLSFLKWIERKNFNVIFTPPPIPFNSICQLENQDSITMLKRKALSYHPQIVKDKVIVL
jgi:hypothetical protein